MTDGDERGYSVITPDRKKLLAVGSVYTHSWTKDKSESIVPYISSAYTQCPRTRYSMSLSSAVVKSRKSYMSVHPV